MAEEKKGIAARVGDDIKNNPGTASGAGIGAVVGTFILPGVGTAAGALAGGYLGRVLLGDGDKKGK